VNIELSKGYVELLDVDSITSRKRKAIFASMATDGGTLKVAPIDISDVLLGHLIVKWNVDGIPAPSLEDLSPLDDLNIKDYDKLAEAASIIMRDITPNFDPNPDPASPTSPSGD